MINIFILVDIFHLLNYLSGNFVMDYKLNFVRRHAISANITYRGLVIAVFVILINFLY